MKAVIGLLLRLAWWQVLMALPIVAVRFALQSAGLNRVPADANEIRVASFADGLEYESEATEFRGGAIAWGMGGLVLDLRGARLAEGGGDLRIVTLMGGSVVIVPPDWRVTLDQRSVMGGAEDAPEPESAGGPELRISALTVMGGLSIARKAPKDGGDTTLA
jgi:predicted membrane protein